MPNVNSPFGAKPLNTLVASDFNAKTNVYSSSVTDVNPIYINDFVTSSTGANSNGVLYASQATSSSVLTGIVVAVKRRNKEELIYREASTEVDIFVLDDPLIEFEIQANGLVTAADIGKEANIIVGIGNTVTGLSGMQLDISTIGNANAQLKIVGIVEREGNVLGSYPKLRCIIANHSLANDNYWNRDSVAGTISPKNIDDDLYIHGKLTVDGLIDPTGLIVSPQATPPSTLDGTHYYNSVLKAFQFRADGKWVHLPQPYPVINIAADFPTVAEVYLGATYRIGTNVTDNDATKTNTGQVFLAGQEIFWNGVNWTISGDASLWGDDTTNLYPISAGRNINLLTGGLKDTNVSTAIKLGDALNTSFATTNKTIVGALNEAYIWKRIDLGAGDYVLTPVTATDEIQVPTSGNAGQILYTDLGSNKKITGSNTLIWDASGITNTAASPYFRAASNLSTSALSGLKLYNTNDGSSSLYHNNEIGDSILDIDALTGTNGISTIRLGYNTTATTYRYLFWGGPASYSSHPTFNSDTQLVDKKYVDDLAGAQTPITEELTIASNGQTAFTLSQTPHTVAYVNLYLNGQRRRYTVDFIVSGTTLTWNDPGGLTLQTTDSPLIVVYEY